MLVAKFEAGGDVNGAKRVAFVSADDADAKSFFFFSSRRRHTRLVSDWSSDVCSSDLERRVDDSAPVEALHLLEGVDAVKELRTEGARGRRDRVVQHAQLPRQVEDGGVLDPDREPGRRRSEERRVGKECTARGWG